MLVLVVNAQALCFLRAEAAGLSWLGALSKVAAISPSFPLYEQKGCSWLLPISKF